MRTFSPNSPLHDNFSNLTKRTEDKSKKVDFHTYSQIIQSLQNALQKPDPPRLHCARCFLCHRVELLAVLRAAGYHRRRDARSL